MPTIPKKSNEVTKAQVDSLIESVSNIEAKLDTLINFQRTIMNATLPMPKVGEEQEKVLELCDKKHTLDEIVQLTGKNKNTIKPTLNALKKKGLIRSLKINKKVVYERIR